MCITYCLAALPIIEAEEGLIEITLTHSLFTFMIEEENSNGFGNKHVNLKHVVEQKGQFKKC
jgi:hypothetical protein